MWSAIASILLGISGWLLASFFGKPWLDFMSLRSQVHEETIFTANVGGLADADDLRDAALSLRRLAAKMGATSVAAPRVLRRYLSLRGYDLDKAKGGLAGLSNSLASSDGGRALHLNRVQVGLRLPRDFDDLQLRTISERISSASSHE